MKKLTCIILLNVLMLFTPALFGGFREVLEGYIATNPATCLKYKFIKNDNKLVVLSLWKDKHAVFNFYQSAAHRTYKEMVGRPNPEPALRTYSKRLQEFSDGTPVILINTLEGEKFEIEMMEGSQELFVEKINDYDA